MIDTKTFTISTKGINDIINLTNNIENKLLDSKINSGILNVFMAGSTGGITTIEFEPGLVKDIKEFLSELIPYEKKYKHHETWGCDNGSSHLKSALISPSFTVPFNNNKMLLGTWQQIIFIEFDTRARNREIILQILGE